MEVTYLILLTGLLVLQVSSTELVQTSDNKCLNVSRTKLVQTSDKCLDVSSVELKMDWIMEHAQKGKGWYIAFSSKLDPALEDTCDAEAPGFLDNGEEFTKKCGTALMKTPNGEKESRWECSFKGNNIGSEKCVWVAVNSTKYTAAITFKGVVELTHTDQENYILTYGCQQNKAKTKVQHRWWAATSSALLPKAARKKLFDDVESLGFDRKSFQCPKTSKTAWKKVTYETCPMEGGSNSCWTCSTGNKGA